MSAAFEGVETFSVRLDAPPGAGSQDFLLGYTPKAVFLYNATGGVQQLLSRFFPTEEKGGGGFTDVSSEAAYFQNLTNGGFEDLSSNNAGISIVSLATGVTLRINFDAAAGGGSLKEGQDIIVTVIR